MSDRDLKDGLKAAGYSFEEFWFYRHNRELIDERHEKQELETRRAKDRGHLKLIQGGLSATPAGAAPATVKKAA